MKLEGIDNLSKQDKFKGKIKKVEDLLEKDDIKEAFYKLALILEYINTKFIISKLNVNIKYTDIMKFIGIYRDRDTKLYNKMVDINDQYNLVSEYGIDEDDVSLLALKVDSIYEYMVENYGEFI